jgi:hypothetical protein
MYVRATASRLKSRKNKKEELYKTELPVIINAKQRDKLVNTLSVSKLRRYSGMKRTQHID